MSVERVPGLALRKLSKNVVARYAVGVVTVIVAFALRKLLEPFTGTGAPFVLFFGAVLITSIVAGTGPGILATSLSIPVGAYTFIVRAGFPSSEAVLQSALFAVDCLIVVYLSFLVTRARRIAECATERLQLATEAAAIRCWDLDVATGRLRWSPTLDVPAKLDVWRRLVHPDDRDGFERAYKHSLDPAGDGVLQCEIRIGRANGEVRWLSCVGRTYFLDGVPIRQVGTATDVTLRRQREDDLKQLTTELARSEARARDVLDLAPDAFFLADLEGRMVDVNQTACRLLGYDRDELVGKTILDVIPAEDAPRLAATRAELLTPGRVHRGEWTQKRKDGTLVPVEISSNILGDGHWQAFVRDITERKRIEDERQVYVSLVENAPDFIGIADPTGTPVYVNPAGRRMIGLPADHPVEHTRIAEYYPPADRTFAIDVILRTMLERGSWSGETHFRNWETGETIPVSDEHFLIRDATGRRVLGMGTITRDISEARQIAREREELLAREQLIRRQAEAANEQLRESEERFRLTIDEAPIGMALVALDGRFVRVNNAYCEIVGYTADEMTRMRFQDITHPDDVDLDVAFAGQLARGEIPRVQLDKRYIRKDGTIVDIRLSASILRGGDAAPRYFIAQVEDITERNRAEQNLRFSEARFSGIISIAADAIISIDDEQRITLFNDGAERTFGYSRSEVVGARLDVLIPERFRAVHRGHVARFATGQVTARQVGERLATIAGRRKTGEEFPAEAAISKLQLGDDRTLTVVLRDVTARTRIENQQRLLAEAGAVLASSLDYEQTLATLGQLVVRELADWCIVDLLEGPHRPRWWKIVGADGEVEQLLLDRSEPFLVRPAIETRRPYLRARVTPADVDAAAHDADHLRLLRALDPRSVMALPLLARGDLIGVLVLLSTTPARVYTPDDLRFAEVLADRAALAIENGRLYQAAVQATQLRDQLLGVVAHDLRNPLGTIQIQAETLERPRPEPERRNQRPKQVILRAANRMNRLIQDLLDVTLVEAGQLGLERVRVSPPQLLADAVETQRSLASSASLDVQLDLASELPEISGDPHRLIQVLENLVGNAIKFTPPGGRVTVGAAPRGADVMFWVADTGAGISPAELPRIFDRFWQGKKGPRHGAGLGLPITRGIVEAHGGRIWVESTPGRGSIFFFTIPRAASPDAMRSASTPS